MDLDKFTNDLIDKKMSENNELIKITFYELRVKDNLSDDVTRDVIEIITEKLQETYKIYYTGSKYSYNGVESKVEDNVLMVAIKV